MRCVAESYQLFRHEVNTHWTTGVVMTGVAAVVGRVYGRTAALGIVLLTVSNYQIIGQQIRVISWMNLRKTLIAIVIFGNGYYKVIDPQIMSYIAVALILIDNFQLSSINADLSSQNETLNRNNAKLIEIHESFKKLEKELVALEGPAADLQEAQEENTRVAENLSVTIPERIQDIPVRLNHVSALLKKLLNEKEMKEMIEFEADLRNKVDTMLKAFDGFVEKLKPITEKAEELSLTLDSTVTNLQTNVTLTSNQVICLKAVLTKVESYSQGRIR